MNETVAGSLIAFLVVLVLALFIGGASLLAELAELREQILHPGKRILVSGDTIICRTLDHEGAPLSVQLQVDANGFVRLPYSTSFEVAGFECATAESDASEKSRKAWKIWKQDRESQAEEHIRQQVTGALAEVNQSLELQLRKLHETTKSLGWENLHQHYRLGTLQFARRGTLVEAIVQAAPSGMTFITWKTAISRPIAYWVIIKQDKKVLAAERAYMGHVTRQLVCGADHVFTVEVYDDPPQRNRSPINREPGFEFVINIPSAKAWEWSTTKKRQNKTSKIVGQLKEVAKERKEVEQAIDGMDLEDEEKDLMKSKYVASKLKAFE